MQSRLRRITALDLQVLAQMQTLFLQSVDKHSGSVALYGMELESACGPFSLAQLESGESG